MSFITDVIGKILKSGLKSADWDTAGEVETTKGNVWDGGRLRWAKWAPCHSGRVGSAIKPWGVVVHTTNMNPYTTPASFHALVKSWSTKPGAGNAAHFILGRSNKEGLVQMVDVGRNANHAGGKSKAGRPQHGWFSTKNKYLHPNSVTVGIEVHAAGLLRLVKGAWRTCISKEGQLTPHGPVIPFDEVEVDHKHESIGWHKPSQYQLTELGSLLEAISECPVLVAHPSDWGVFPNGEAPVWAPKITIDGMPVVGHVTLDPNRKSDPEPPLSRWLTDLGK